MGLRLEQRGNVPHHPGIVGDRGAIIGLRQQHAAAVEGAPKVQDAKGIAAQQRREALCIQAAEYQRLAPREDLHRQSVPGGSHEVGEGHVSELAHGVGRRALAVPERFQNLERRWLAEPGEDDVEGEAGFVPRDLIESETGEFRRSGHAAKQFGQGEAQGRVAGLGAETAAPEQRALPGGEILEERFGNFGWRQRILGFGKADVAP